MGDFAARLPLARHRTDRDDAGRGAEGLIAGLLEDEATRLLLLWRGNARLHAVGEQPALDLRSPAEVPFTAGIAQAVYLGRTTAPRRGGDPAGTRVVSLSLDEQQATAIGADPAAWASLREVALHLDEVDAGLFTQALAIHNWHQTHGHSPATGAATVPEHGGWVRRAPAEERLIFPRTDAAIIAAVVDRDDRILLGANRQWSPRRYSLLAGFVEPGESFEAAVAREVWEEAGARIVEPRYLGSQPWPFPASIMVGFIARLDPEQDPASVRPDLHEIIDLRWFTRDEVAASAELLPSRVSIARAIIEEWYGRAFGD